MSLKDLFKKEKFSQVLTKKSKKDLEQEVESSAFVPTYLKKSNRVLPQVDYSDPKNFARYGLASRYYRDSIERIYKEYPYDGSLREKMEWDESSLLIDKYIFEEHYPRTNGYINFLGSREMSTVAGNFTSFTHPYAYNDYAQYIFLKGGPHPSKLRGTETLSGELVPSSSINSLPNYYDSNINRTSNLEFNGTDGVTVEFWLRKDSYQTASESPTQTVFDLWSSGSWGADVAGQPGYGRLKVVSCVDPVASGSSLYISLMSGSGQYTQGVFDPQPATIGGETLISIGTDVPVTSSTWHHYALSFANTGSNMRARLYVDGALNQEIVTGSSISSITGTMVAQLGALITSPSGSHAATQGYGALSGSLDEFRFWRKERTPEQIGRYWKRQIGGGTNTDDVKYYYSGSVDEGNAVELGFYYKFNEGITQTASVDSNILDYSGRVTNGTWTGYSNSSALLTDMRSTNSAIVEASASAAEFKDPIIYERHPDVQSLLETKIKEGELHDLTNNASIFNSFPSWIREETEDNPTLEQLSQIMGSYFDELHIMIEDVNKVKDIRYVSGSLSDVNKESSIAKNLLSGVGFDTPELFVDAEVIEKFLQMGDDRTYSQSIDDIKNLIYKNIYNNLTHIMKSKGTVKSLRNLMHCFGVSEDLIKINTFADNMTFAVKDEYYDSTIKKTFLDFSSLDASSAAVYQQTSSLITDSTAYLSASGYPAAQQESDGFGSTFESEVLFPYLPDQDTVEFKGNYPLTSSIFGAHSARLTAPADTTWQDDSGEDYFFEVRSVKSVKDTRHSYFQLASPLLSTGFLETEVFYDVYDNSNWTFAVKVAPSKYPQSTLDNRTVGTADTYVVEFYGVNNVQDIIKNEFHHTETISNTLGKNFMSSAKRLFAGASVANFTGSVNFYSDVKISSVKAWMSHLTNEEIKSHAIDAGNYGTRQPANNAFVFQTGSTSNDGSTNVFIPKIKTLALDWDFGLVTGSDAAGAFAAYDITSGSSDLRREYGWLGNVVNLPNSGIGRGFPASTASFVSVEYLEDSKKQLPEILYSEDMVSILSFDDDNLYRDQKPVGFFTSIEKNMYQALSEEIMNFFASIRDYGALIGRTEERYRQDYKRLSFLKQIFFERLGNTPDVDRFVEYFKWIDQSLGTMIMNLVPASANINKGIKTVIESHALERNKYRNKFPTIDSKFAEPASSGQLQPNLDTTKVKVNLAIPDTLAGKYQDFIAKPNPSLAGPKLNSPPSTDQDVHILWWKNKVDKTKFAKTGNAALDVIRQKLFTVFQNSNQDLQNKPFVFSTSVKAKEIAGGAKMPANKKGMSIASKILSFASNKQFVINNSNVSDPTKTYIEEIIPIELLTKRKIVEVNIDNEPDAYLVSGSDSVLPFAFYSASHEYDSGASLGGYLASLGVSLSNTQISFGNDFSNNEFETPLQGPFTERFVGGYQYRNVAPNKLDEAGNFNTAYNRPEGYNIVLASNEITVVPVDSINTNFARGTRIRLPGVKRPVNITNRPFYATSGSVISGNLNFTNPTRTVGNFERNYELVMTTGRDTNNLWFKSGSTGAGGASNQYAEVLTLTGNLNFALPDRATGSNKTVIAERFSAPGSKEVLTRGLLDPASETYSVYNQLNYRNSVVRTSLNVSGTLHSLAYGIQTGSFAIGDAYSSLVMASSHKVNRNARRTVFVTGTSYFAPVISVVVSGSRFDNDNVTHQIPQSDRNYNWITASMLDINGAPYGFANAAGFVSSAAGEVSEFKFLSASQTSVNSHVVDFVGLNTLINAPLLTGTNAVSTASLNTSIASLSSADLLNALLLHQNGPYGFVSWKQINNSTNPLVRNMVKNNRISTFTAMNDFFTKSKYKWSGASGKEKVSHNSATNVRRLSSFTEPPVITSFKPITHKVATKDYDGNKANFDIKHSYANNLSKFASPDLNNSLGAESNKPTQAYDKLYKIYTNKELGEDNPISDLLSLEYKENVYPRSVNAYLGKSRGRQNYTEVPGTGQNGFDRREHRTFWRDSLFARERTAATAVNSQGYTIYNNQSRTLSVWPVDCGDVSEIAGLYGFPIDLTDLNGAVGELTHYPFVNPTGSVTDGIFPSGFYAPMYGYHVSASAAMHRRAINHKVYADTYIRPPVYRTNILAGKNPWFDSYEDYSEDIRRIAKDYTVLPEFRISDHMDFYLNNQTASFVGTNNKFLSLDGTAHTSSAQGEFAEFDESFFNVYSNSDFMKYFDVIQEDHVGEEIGKPSKIKMTCRGVKKLLPYNGFYPTTRTLQLASLLSQSLGPFLSGSTENLNNPDTERLNAVNRLFVAPGLLFNSIKSAVAVDFPYYTSAVSGTTAYPGGSTAIQQQLLGYETPYDMRLPFEALVDITKHLPPTIKEVTAWDSLTSFQTNLFLGEPTATGSHPYVNWMFEKKPNFELAMHNFLGETVKFFLKNESLTNFYSAQQSQFKTMKSGSTYGLRVNMFKSNGMTLTENVDANPSRGRARGAIYGPPMSSSYWASKSHPSLSGFDDPAYAPHTPPYFYGLAQASLSFECSETKKYTLQEILAGLTVSYANAHPGLVLNCSASLNKMEVSSSMNLFGTTRVQKVNYSTGLGPEGNYLPSSFETPADDAFDVWSIGTKWECPALNFSASHTSTEGVGIWAGYGTIPDETTGVYTGLSNVSEQESLLEVVGFQTTREKIGKIADAKEISEGVVAIPFVDSPDLTDLETVEYLGKSFFKIDSDTYKYQTELKEAKGIAVEKASTEDGADNVQQTSITDMYEKMHKYVIPPQLDFTDKDLNKSPFVMYIFDFNHTLDQKDLADIWQGVMPKISITAEKQDITIEHAMSKHEFFGGMPLPPETRWMVFKVKKRAENNYFKVTADSKDDDRFKFLFKSSEKDYKHSYNWPYDFFSLVELGQIEAAVEIEGDKKE